jgi:8-oxo-dGTP pyrophosphatase MutT (NUDIX family)
VSDPGYVRNSRRTTYENAWLRFEAHDMVHPNGRAGEHGVVVTPRASAVVVLDGDDVVLTRQARYAIDRTMVEIVKGGSEPHESAQEAAARELREELGLEAARWDDLGIVYEIPSIVQEGVALFLARDVRAVPTDPEDVETIVEVRMPFEEALRAAGRGDITDAVTAVALMRVAARLAGERV